MPFFVDDDDSEKKYSYEKDTYIKELKTKVIARSDNGKLTNLELEDTIFYPEGGGQPSDKGEIQSHDKVCKVKYVRSNEGKVIHQCPIQGAPNIGDEVTCVLNWNYRYNNMKTHTAGHLINDVVLSVEPGLKPLKASHGKKPEIFYSGTPSRDIKEEVQRILNEDIIEDKKLLFEYVSYEELSERCSFVPKLPPDKSWRIVWVEGYEPMPCGGTHVKATSELEEVEIISINTEDEKTSVRYRVK